MIKKPLDVFFVTLVLRKNSIWVIVVRKNSVRRAFLAEKRVKKWRLALRSDAWHPPALFRRSWHWWLGRKINLEAGRLKDLLLQKSKA